MPTNTDTTMVKQLSDSGPDGTTIGSDALDKVSLYNVTPIAQQAFNANTSLAQPAASTSTFVASIQSLAFYAATEVDSIKAILRKLGVAT